LSYCLFVEQTLSGKFAVVNVVEQLLPCLIAHKHETREAKELLLLVKGFSADSELRKSIPALPAEPKSLQTHQPCLKALLVTFSEARGRFMFYSGLSWEYREFFEKRMIPSLITVWDAPLIDVVRPGAEYTSRVFPLLIRRWLIFAPLWDGLPVVQTKLE
jgi:hypothetical protein